MMNDTVEVISAVVLTIKVVTVNSCSLNVHLSEREVHAIFQWPNATKK